MLRNYLKKLTPREREVLGYVIANPDDNLDEIGEHFKLSPKTISKYLGNIYIKFGIEGEDTEKRGNLIEWYKDMREKPSPLKTPLRTTPEEPIVEKSAPEITIPPKPVVPEPEREIYDRPPRADQRIQWWLIAFGVIATFVVGILVGRLIDLIPRNPQPSATLPSYASFTPNLTQIAHQNRPVTATYTREPTPTAYGFQLEQLPPPGEVLEFGQAYSKDGLLCGTNKDIGFRNNYGSKVLIGITLWVKNLTLLNYIVRYRIVDMRLVDNLGNEIPISSYHSGGIEETITISLGSMEARRIGNGMGDILEFEGDINPKATQLILVVDAVGLMKNMRWKLDLQ